VLESLCYEEKDALLHNTHPLVTLLFLAALCFQALLFTHPLYLLGVFSAGILTAVVSDAYGKCRPYLKLGLWVAGLLIAINALFVHAGQTVIWQGPDLPVLGRLDLHLEAVCYGAAMGVRLLILLLVFALYNAVVHPDKIMSLFSRLAFKSALILSLSTRMVPAIARELANVVEVQQMRGVRFGAGGLGERLRKYSWLLEVILTSSLEGALQVAESMQARAFGSGPRTHYQRFLLRRRDCIIGLLSLLALILALCVKARGYGDYTYYPQLGPLGSAPALIWLGLLMLSPLAVILMGWGWRRCLSWRSGM